MGLFPGCRTCHFKVRQRCGKGAATSGQICRTPLNPLYGGKGCGKCGTRFTLKNKVRQIGLQSLRIERGDEVWY